MSAEIPPAENPASKLPTAELVRGLRAVGERYSTAADSTSHLASAAADRLEASSARIRGLEHLARQFRGWDHLDGAGDGPYWRAYIDKVLEGATPLEGLVPMCRTCIAPQQCRAFGCRAAAA